MNTLKGYLTLLVFLPFLIFFSSCKSIQNYDTESDKERGSRSVKSIMKIVVPSFKNVRNYGVIAVSDTYTDGKKYDYLLFATGVNKPSKSDIANFDISCASIFTREDAVVFANGLENVLHSWARPPLETDAFYYDFRAFTKTSTGDLFIKPENRSVTFRFSCAISKNKKSTYMEWGFCGGDLPRFRHTFTNPIEINELKLMIEEGYFLLTNKTGWKRY